jgi:hypothetical protein
VCGDRRLNHRDGKAERSHRKVKQRGASVRVIRRPPAAHASSRDEKRGQGSDALARASSFNVSAFRTDESGSSPTTGGTSPALVPGFASTASAPALRSASL